MAAMDLLGRRWTLRILWELRAGALGSRALQGRCDAMSSSVLYQRLGEMQVGGLVTKNLDGDYELTDIGRALGPALRHLDAWAEQWAASLR
jgi:DNA-binding HxlR family transcriptional regulator